MKLIRITLILAAIGAVAGLAYVGQKSEGSGAAMATAAGQFLDTLSADQKKIAQFPFDSGERFNWNFIPLQDKAKKPTRKGLALVDMTADQKKAALALLKSGTSEKGFETAQLIMSLEAILKEQETKGTNVRDPEWYFVTIFGAPGKSGKWGWRWEGHHLSINMTLEGTQVVAATPFFFGANPAEIKTGMKKGYKVLAEAQDLAASIFDSLDADQKKTAHKDKAFGEPGQKTKEPKLGDPVGLAAAKMNNTQKEGLAKLVKHYTDRMPKDVGSRELKELAAAGVDNIHFAFTGETGAGKGRTYRIQGPTFVIEFLNVQGDSGGNANNHIHSAQRRIKGDFGLK